MLQLLLLEPPLKTVRGTFSNEIIVILETCESYHLHTLLPKNKDISNIGTNTAILAPGYLGPDLRSFLYESIIRNGVRSSAKPQLKGI